MYTSYYLVVFYVKKTSFAIKCNANWKNFKMLKLLLLEKCTEIFYENKIKILGYSKILNLISKNVTPNI